MSAFPGVNFQVDYQPFLLRTPADLASKFSGCCASRLSELLCEKYGERSKGMLEQLCQAATDVQLTFSVNRPLIVDTVASHCLIQYARSVNRQNDVVEALLVSYFVDGYDISNVDVLCEISRLLGLDVQRVRQVITDEGCRTAIREHSQKLRTQGITGVPTYVFSKPGCHLRIKFSGSQPVEVFAQAIKQLLEAPTGQ